ncbi:MAG: hypothetical protein AAF673_00455 [Pseudomonadota bacterium]
MLFILLTTHPFTPLTAQEHRVWIKKVNEGDSVTFKFWFKESNELVFIQEGKELGRVKFEAYQTKYFSFREWHRFPMVRFCNENGVFKMWLLSKETFQNFVCSGEEISLGI